jgi:hypothetical protein
LHYCFLKVLNVFYFYFFRMAPSLHLPSIWNILCPHYASLYILSDLSTHLKSTHLLLASFPRLTKLFFLCRYPPLLCFFLVLFLLFLGVRFKPILAPF